MKFIETDFKDLFIVEIKPLEDERGWFSRVYDVNLFRENIPNFTNEWKQFNHSFNFKKGTFRGLHFQYPPFQETKLVRCISGKVIDFAVDLRNGSETFLKVFQIELSEENKKMVYLPKGFAHGFFTLEDSSQLLYFSDEFYKPDYDSGVYFQDQAIKDLIDIKPLVISNKDLNHKILKKDFSGI